MRFYALALLAGATILSACGGSGGDNAAKDTSKVAPAPAPPAGAPAGALAPMPATGDTVTVKMVGDDKGYRFEPADITVKTGQAIKFVMTSGGPHNVAFDPATVPADSKDQLNANMTGQMSELSSPILMNPNEAYVVSFAGVKPGKYPFHCTPHLQMNMKGTVTVQ
jgi:plastocyanin